MIRNWLNVIPASEQTFTLMESTTFQTEIMRSKLWYRGNASELSQFFRQLNKQGRKTAFWESVSSNENIRKIHIGLPAIIADTIAYIVSSDLDKVDAERGMERNIRKHRLSKSYQPICNRHSCMR